MAESEPASIFAGRRPIQSLWDSTLRPTSPWFLPLPRPCPWPFYGAMDSAMEKPASSTASRPLTAAKGRVRLRTLVVIRWVGIAGQAAALLIVHYGPRLSAAHPVGRRGRGGLRRAQHLPGGAPARLGAALRPHCRGLQLAYDMLQLAVLLYLTGGLGNPFAILILAPVIVSATVLSRFSTVCLSLLALASIAILSHFHLALPWPNEDFRLEPLFILGAGPGAGRLRAVLRRLRAERLGRGAPSLRCALRNPDGARPRAPALRCGRARRRRRP